MSRGKSSNVAASVRRRLLNIIRETGDDTNLVWTRYATERLLYRLSVSEYVEDFILKGAMLFMAWTGQSHRPTVGLLPIEIVHVTSNPSFLNQSFQLGRLAPV
jgi:hypothetical protein